MESMNQDLPTQARPDTFYGLCDELENGMEYLRTTLERNQQLLELEKLQSIQKLKNLHDKAHSKLIETEKRCFFKITEKNKEISKLRDECSNKIYEKNKEISDLKEEVGNLKGEKLMADQRVKSLRIQSVESVGEMEKLMSEVVYGDIQKKKIDSTIQQLLLEKSMLDEELSRRNLEASQAIEKLSEQKKEASQMVEEFKRRFFGTAETYKKKFSEDLNETISEGVSSNATEKKNKTVSSSLLARRKKMRYLKSFGIGPTSRPGRMNFP